MVISFLFVIQPSIKNDENIKITSGINEFVSSTSLKIETNTTETNNNLPLLFDDWLSSYVGSKATPFIIFVEVYENDSLDSVWVEIKNPDNSLTKVYMLPGNLSGKQSITYTPQIAGMYSFIFYAKDDAGNVGKLVSNLTYKVRPHRGGGVLNFETIIDTTTESNNSTQGSNTPLSKDNDTVILEDPVINNTSEPEVNNTQEPETNTSVPEFSTITSILLLLISGMYIRIKRN